MDLAIRARVLRGIFAAVFKKVGEDNFGARWDDLDSKSKEQWKRVAYLVNHVSKVLEKHIDGTEIVIQELDDVIQELKSYVTR